MVGAIRNDLKLARPINNCMDRSSSTVGINCTFLLARSNWLQTANCLTCLRQTSCQLKPSVVGKYQWRRPALWRFVLQKGALNPLVLHCLFEVEGFRENWAPAFAHRAAEQGLARRTLPCFPQFSWWVGICHYTVFRACPGWYKVFLRWNLGSTWSSTISAHLLPIRQRQEVLRIWRLVAS